MVLESFSSVEVLSTYQGLGCSRLVHCVMDMGWLDTVPLVL